jgi:putative ABC transport system permease protein
MITHDSSTDGFHSKREFIYRLLMDHLILDEKVISSFPGLCEKLKSIFPEIEEITHIYYPGTVHLKTGNGGAYIEEKVIFCDTSFFKVFDFNIVSGNRATCLSAPKSIVITSNTAIKYFKSLDVLGENVYFNNDLLTITGIMDNVPSNSHLQFESIISFSTLPKGYSLDYGGPSYLLLNSQANFKELEEKINKLSPKIANYTEKVIDFELQPLEKVYYFKDSLFSYYSPILRYRSTFFLEAFLFLTIIILILALVNFVNYSQALAIIKVNKIKVLKILGITRLQLLLKFFLENIILILSSFILSFLVLIFLLPTFNQLTDSNIAVNFLFNGQFIFITAAITLGTCIFLTLINWIFLSHQSNLASKVSSTNILNLLSIIQICISIILLFIMIVFYKQLQFIKIFPIGLNKHNLVTINISNVQTSIDPRSIKTEILRNSHVVKASLSGGSPISNKWFYSENKGNEEVKINVLSGDEDYLSTLEIRLIYGREFNSENPADTSCILVSELASKKLRIGLDSLYNKKRVIGIFGDIQLSSIRDKTEPAIISYSTFKKTNDNTISLVVRLNEVDQTLLSKIRTDVIKYLPDSEVDFKFLDSEVNIIYKNDFKQGQLLVGISIVVILITMFGIIGVVYFNTERRRKEIAIRKVFGAYSIDIVKLFLIKIVSITFVTTLVSLPVAIYLISHWLDGFAHKTVMNWWIGILPFLIITFITIAATAYNIFASAKDNPTESLKHE